MFKEENLAAAQIAQMFGSELLRVQNSAKTDGGSTPDIVKLDPKQFLVGETQYVNNRKIEERRMVEILQREAEAAFPVAPPQSAPYTPQVPPATIPVHQPMSPVGLAPVSQLQDESWTGGSNSALERIAASLERLANAVDKVDIKPKKKTVKRNKPKSAKITLLNETTA